MLDINKTYISPLTQWDQIQADLKGQPGVYCWINKINHKRYIGQAVDLWVRLSDYQQPWYQVVKGHLPIVRAISKYKIDNFTLEILEILELNSSTLGRDLDDCENKWFAHYKPEYNILLEARSSRGYKHSENIKNLISELKTGSSHSFSTRDKMSETRKGINNPNFGKKVSKEIKESIKLTRLARGNSKFVKVLDTFTNKTVIYSNIKKTAEILQVSYASLKSHQRKPDSLFKKRYLIKFNYKTKD